MTKKEHQPIYVSPNVKTVQLSHRTLLCVSPGYMQMSERDLGDGDFEEQ